MTRTALWLRWSRRDLRARWLQVAAISLIVAIGTGVYTGLSSTSSWRRVSYAASYDKLRVHDIRVALASSTFTEPDRLRAVLREVDAVADVEVRLVAETQVDASSDGTTVLVPGRIVGVEVGAHRPNIDRLWIKRGRGLDASDDGKPRAVIDFHFAKHFHLPTAGSFRVAGDITLDYVGQGFTPEYFMIMSTQGSLLAEAGYAVLFTPLGTAQELAERPGVVNEAVVTLHAGADREQARAAIEDALDSGLDGVAASVESIDDDRVYRLLYDDIQGDQRLYNIFAFLILGGAAFAAFNLIGRIVEAQRREIGVGMALGVSPPLLAVRPLLVGLQVALFGALLGVAAGMLVGVLMADLLRTFLPLPVWRTGFDAATYARGAALGIGLPFVATLIPVWRAVRVTPVEAIRTGPAATKRGGLAPLARRIGFGDSVTQMPLRNLLRAPRRTVVTALAVSAAIATLIGVIGLVDSFLDTIDRGERAILDGAPDRLQVNLQGFDVSGSDRIDAIAASPTVSRVEEGLRLPGTLRADRPADDVDVLLSLSNFREGVFRPELLRGSLATDGTGVVLSEKAADDLGVDVGDTVTLRHPKREDLTGYRWIDSDMLVQGIHANPYRFIVYLDTAAADLMGLRDIVNTVSVVPAAGSSAADVQRALFSLPGVASVEPVAAFAQTIRDAIDESLGFLDIVRFAVMFLALLIAFNSSSISADERAREHATMFAFGLPTHSVLRISMIESFVIAIIGTLGGVALGLALVNWIVHFLLPTTVPDLSVHVAVSASTLLSAAVLGVGAVTIAPILTLRRLRRMDIPATLRVVE